uniref:Uncharacterized protein n=1 Tax=Panagrellus redivivus TaxID=6233 RepID=A0A7E4VPE4_PANRE
MGKTDACICAAYAFAPAVIVFCRFVAKEPMRIILFMLGAFFWLCSLLLTSIIWRLIGTFYEAPTLISVFIFVVNQEIARFLFFLFSQSAYDSLIKLGTSNRIIIPEIRLLGADSRHTFAFVCGLGFGTITCFFSVANVVADLTMEGVPGLPASLENGTYPGGRTYHDVDVPYAYANASSLLLFLNVCWTVLQWDSCHKYFSTAKATPPTEVPSLWWLGMVFGIVSHFANTAISLLSPGGYHWYVLGGQAFIFAISVALTLSIIDFKKPDSYVSFFLAPWCNLVHCRKSEKTSVSTSAAEITVNSPAIPNKSKSGPPPEAL